MERHGDSSRKGAKRLYRIWCNMKNRCSQNNKSSDVKYETYKNVRVCGEWNLYSTFKLWAMSNGYSDDLYLDRIDYNGNYEPSNCRWATASVQNRNTRIKKSNKSGYRGVRLRKDTKKFNAYVYHNSVNISLGCYETAEEAAKIRDRYVIENNVGSILNFPTLS